MVTLTGNLGQRQKQLNEQVIIAARKHQNFDEIRNKEEKSDIDKFFKIDLASRYRKLDYILEVLRGGDSLYITRALKCSWIFADEYSDIMNPITLSETVFPYMSLKMRRKMLVVMATNLRNDERTNYFVQCCLDNHLPQLALKFAVHINEDAKIEFIRENSDLLEEVQSKTYFINFIGDSFELAEILISLLIKDINKVKVLCHLRHLYAISNDTYLGILEKYVHLTPSANTRRLGSRLTKHIFNKHRTRMFLNLKIYVNFLHMNTLARLITAEDAKAIAFDLQPKTKEDFWAENFCVHYSVFINKIPDSERFRLIKNMFDYKYPYQHFDDSMEFYNLKCYKIMSEEERLRWARYQVANNITPQGVEKSLYAYTCLAFETAFRELKSLIEVTDDAEMRTYMMYVLIVTVENQQQMKCLLDYYHDERSVEPQHVQELFLNHLTNLHRVYFFNTECWTIVNNIFKRVKVYDFSYNTAVIVNLRVVTVVYHILKDNSLPEEWKLFITDEPTFIETLDHLTTQISDVLQERLYQYLFNFYVNKISQFSPKNITFEVQKYLRYILDLMSFYGRTDADVPEVVMKFVKVDKGEAATHRLIRKPGGIVTEKYLLRQLKVNEQVLVEKISWVQKTHEEAKKFKLGWLLRKLKVYFSNDIGQTYLQFYHDWLTTYIPNKYRTEAITSAIFILGDEDFKVNFMIMNAPLHDDIRSNKVENKLLTIQRAICCTVYHSRPALPLSTTLMYVRGAYIRSCFQLITSYLINLPLPLCMEFLQAILQTQSLAQRHGVRVAFTHFTAGSLKKLVTYLWKRNRDDHSIRFILYKSVYDKICHEREYAQTALFECLLEFTKELTEDDHEIFNVMVSGGLPEHFISEYMNAAWLAVSSLSDTIVNTQTKTSVIEQMNNVFYSLRNDHVKPIIEDFIEDLFELLDMTTEKIDEYIFYLYNKKWELAGKYITYVRNDNDLNDSLDLVGVITKDCIKLFNVSDGAKYVGRDLFLRFIRFLQTEGYNHPLICFKHVNVIMNHIIETMHQILPLEQAYFNAWELHLDIALRHAIIHVRLYYSQAGDKEERVKIIRDAFFCSGEYIRKLMIELLDSDMYVRSLTPLIFDLMCQKIEQCIYFTEDVEPDDIMTIISTSLIQTRKPEIYLLALLCLPLDYDGEFVEVYEMALSVIKDCEFLDVVTLVFEKFVNTDCKPRHGLALI